MKGRSYVVGVCIAAAAVAYPCITHAVDKKAEGNAPQVQEHEHGNYVIHNHSYFVPTDQEVTPDALGGKIGAIQRIGDWAIKREGDSNWYPPQVNVMYALTGTDSSQEIVLKIRLNSVGESAPNDAYKYQVFKSNGDVSVDAATIFHAKNDEEEIGLALQNIRRVDADFREVKGMTPVLVSYDPQKRYGRLEYMWGQGGEIRVLEYPKSMKGEDPTSVFGESFSSQKLVPGKTKTINGIEWTQYNEVLFVARQGDRFYEVHFLNCAADEQEFMDVLNNFQTIDKTSK